MTNSKETQETVTEPENSRKSLTVKRLATEVHPTIQAVISEMFRFVSRADAVERLEAIKDNFIITTRLPKPTDKATIKLWIRGYQITKDEEASGYLGNYAAIKIKKIDGKFSLIAEKQKVGLKFHPQRKRPKKHHPDWGHPVLRAVKKGIVYDTIEEANKVLGQLHEEYPAVTIPNPGKLYIIIYHKVPTDKKPASSESIVQKYVLEIKPSREGGYFVEYRLNKVDTIPKQPIPVPKKRTQEIVESENKIQGYFTSMVELKKSKSRARKKPLLKKPNPHADE